MQISYENILYHLLERGFVPLERAVVGGLEIFESSSRNKNYIVRQPGGPNYFIKQTNLQKANGKGYLFREASLYRLLFQETETASDSQLGPLQSVFPAFVEYDTGLEILVLDYVENSNNLNSFHRQNSRFAPEVAFQLGANLAKVHVPAESLADTSFLPRSVPWILSIHRMNFAYTHHNKSNPWIAQIIHEQGEFHPYLDDLHRGWRREQLIHGDIKWDNCLVNGSNRLFLVDWETADIGDAAWDVGAVLHGFLIFWVMSLSLGPLKAGNSAAEVTSENYPIEAMHPSIRAFWQGYIESGNLSTEADEFLLRSVNYAAARMLQSAFEQMRDAPQITGNALVMLQVSLNILQNPRAAVSTLLGLQE